VDTPHTRVRAESLLPLRDAEGCAMRRACSWIVVVHLAMWLAPSTLCATSALDSHVSQADTIALAVLATPVGEQAGSEFGSTVTILGDLNADGTPELAAGAPAFGLQSGSTFIANVGRTYVFFGGGGAPNAGAIAADWQITGRSISRGEFGGALAGVGDVDADGFGDFLVGAPGDSGRAFLFRGQRKLPSVSTAEDADLEITNHLPASEFAASLASMGDVNGDGYADFVVGATFGEFEKRAGEAYLYLGGRTLDATPDLVYAGAQDSSVIDDDGVRGDSFSRSLAVVDLDEDGVRDLVVGAPRFNGNSGRVFVFFSDPGLVGTPTPDTLHAGEAYVIFTGDPGDGWFGRSLAIVNDLNGDSRPDLVIGSPFEGSNTEAGRAYVYFNGPHLRGVVPASSADLVLVGLAPGNEFGWSVVPAGDLDGDGRSELLVGARVAGGTGQAYVFTAREMLAAIAAGKRMLGPQSAVLLQGEDIGDGFGGSAALLADVNVSGNREIAVVAKGHNSDRGKVYIYSVDHPVCELSAAKTDFGVVSLGTCDTLSVEVRNVGGSLSQMRGAIAADCIDFSIPDSTKVSLGFGQTRSFPVVFCPSSQDVLYKCDVQVALTRGTPPVPLQLKGSTLPTPGELAPATAEAGEHARVRAYIQDGLDPMQVELAYRNGGGRFYSTVLMEENATTPNLYEGIIPAETVNQRGVQFYVDVTVAPEMTSRIPGQGLASVDVHVSGLPALEIKSMAYEMRGFPLHAECGTSTVIFESVLGPYDPAQWRYLTFDGSRYLEGPDAFIPDPGQGFWIVSRRTAEFRVNGLVTDLSRLFEIELHPGFNQISNPFGFSVGITDLIVPAEFPLNFIAWDGTQYLQDQQFLLPGVGYWLENPTRSNRTLLIPPLPPIEGVAKASSMPSPWRRSAAERGWSVEMSATAGRFQDHRNLLGMRELASDGVDALDISESPAPPGDFVGIALFAANGKPLQVDMRAPAADGAQWLLQLDARSAGADVQPVPYSIAFIDADELPEGWTLVAMGESGAEEQDLLQQPVLEGVLRTEGTRLRWTLLAGSQEWIRERAVVVRNDLASPALGFGLRIGTNPFRSARGTSFQWVAPRLANYTLQVFDVRGRLVRALVDAGFPAGTYRSSWDGTSSAGVRVGAGAYFVRLQGDGNQLTRKVVVLQ